MTRRKRIAIVWLVLLLPLPATATAWNGTGHRVTAAIAWDQMSPDARAAAVELLKAHPGYERDLLADLCEVSFSNPDAWVKAGNNAVINNEVGEAQWADNIHYVDEPDFPMVDTSDYLPYATTKIIKAAPLGTQFVNILIPPNTNPTFAAGSEFYGVIYVQSPNNVKFAGKAAFHGVLVTENDSTGSWGSGNSIEFMGGVTADGVSALPDSDARFTGLKDMGGAFILAENFSVKFSGNTALGSNAITGSIVASNISFGGTADTVIDGSVINLEPTSGVYFSGNGSVTIKSSGTKSQPHGLYFGSRYVPLPGSYEETAP